MNGNQVRDNDFGKLGAFVQQDDVLHATQTVSEALEFACALRTNLTGQELKDRVTITIKKLGLEACKDTMIGGWLMKGISGGERKRTSIGFELITNPSLLLLDEPTSGLDSSTSLRIIRMLR